LNSSQRKSSMPKRLPHGRFKRLSEKPHMLSRRGSFWKIERLGRHLTLCSTQSEITKWILGKRAETSRSKK